MALVGLSGVVDGVVAVVGCSLELAGLVDGVVSIRNVCNLVVCRQNLAPEPTVKTPWGGWGAGGSEGGWQGVLWPGGWMGWRLSGVLGYEVTDLF